MFDPDFVRPHFRPHGSALFSTLFRPHFRSHIVGLTRVDMHHMRRQMHCTIPTRWRQMSKLKALAPLKVDSTLKKSTAVEHLGDESQMVLSPFQVEAKTTQNNWRKKNIIFDLKYISLFSDNGWLLYIPPYGKMGLNVQQRLYREDATKRKAFTWKN